MSQLSGNVLTNGILGAAAVALTFGAVQLASGRDLSEANPAGTSGADVNRAAKADRSGGMAGMAVQTQTISLRLDGLANTSILIRVPVVREARGHSSAPFATKSGDHKTMVACEPVVSVLTEVFKQLQPGRCVT
jgi:hypothetical protein